MSQVCDPIPFDCDICYETSLAYSSLMTVAVGLTPAATVYVFITNMKGDQFVQQTIVNGLGAIVIDVTNFPNGMFNQYAGQFDMMICSDSGGVNRLHITIYATKYNCLKFKITC